MDKLRLFLVALFFFIGLFFLLVWVLIFDKRGREQELANNLPLNSNINSTDPYSTKEVDKKKYQHHTHRAVIIAILIQA